MKKISQSNLTVDVPKPVKAGMDALALVLCLTNVRGGEEVPNRSGMARILLEIGMSHADEFLTWLEETEPHNSPELHRFTFQAPNPFIDDLEKLARKAGLTRAEEGSRVPNLTQIVRRLLEFVLSRPDLIEYWFEEKIRGTMGVKAG